MRVYRADDICKFNIMAGRISRYRRKGRDMDDMLCCDCSNWKVYWSGEGYKRAY